MSSLHPESSRKHNKEGIRVGRPGSFHVSRSVSLNRTTALATRTSELRAATPSSGWPAAAAAPPSARRRWRSTRGTRLAAQHPSQDIGVKVTLGIWCLKSHFGVCHGVLLQNATQHPAKSESTCQNPMHFPTCTPKQSDPLRHHIEKQSHT